jgi:hypothetical protein
MVQQIPPTGLSDDRLFRNKVINGDFQIFQRATAATTAAQNTYNTADRWKAQVSNDGAFTTEQETLSLADQATTGSATAFEIKCTSTDSSIAAGQYALISQDIEAQYLQDLLYGTSSAKDITVSFWCKSNLTGTFSLFLIKMDSTAYYIPTEFSLSSADTWEKKTITITPTQGSTSFITGSAAIINNDNGHGIQLGIALAAGSNLQGTNNTWSTSANYTTSNQVNFLSSTDNNFYLTNVQLEIGSDATDFEKLPFDVQFQRCQRYLQCITHNATTSGNVTGDNKYVMDVHFYNDTACYGSYMFPVQMRGTPTVVATDTSNAMRVYYKGTYDSIDNLSLEGTARFNHILLSNFTDIADNDQAGAAGHIYNYDNAQVFVDAEL